MRSTAGLVTAAIALFAIGTDLGSATAQSVSEVAVIGSEGLPATIEGGVAVVRGPAPPPRPSPVIEAAPLLPTAVAGRTLWLLDAETGKLIGCNLRSSGHVGGKRIRCGDRSLLGLLRR